MDPVWVAVRRVATAVCLTQVLLMERGTQQERTEEDKAQSIEGEATHHSANKFTWF
jgi:hypothetical protein